MAAKIQATAEDGGWHARVVPRGGGKTTLCAAGIEWSALRGAKQYPVILAATDGLAARILRGIKTQIFSNAMLLEDFPHAIFPIWKLGNEARRAAGQKYHGQPTYIEWNMARIVFPWIEHEDSLSAGVIIEAYGVTGAIRGLKHTRPDGSTARPDIGLVDDPQTRESAKSVSQSQTRREILTGDIAYLAGPGEAMPLFCTATIIYDGDLACQILDRQLHPEWQGEKTRMVESFPANLELWDKYAEILRSSLREDGDGHEAKDFYAANRAAMDAGSVVSWEARKRDDELSAIQHAMNWKIKDEAAFYAECQNEPLIAQDDFELLSEAKIAAKVFGYKRGVVPPECSVLTAFTDVQKEHLFWMVCGWTPDFSGYVIDYGAWPDQKRNYFTRRDVRKKLSQTYTGDEGGQVYAALTELADKIGGGWTSADGRALNVSRWCIDGNWRTRTPAVVSFAKQSSLASVITVTQGRGVKATENPFSQAVRAKQWHTEKRGYFWQDGPGPARWVTFDANFWKTRIHQGLSLSIGSKGSIQLFLATQQVHQMLAEHLRAEKPIKVEAHGRTVYEWVERPGRDNEGLDCLVGCALGASMCGISRNSERSPEKKKPMSLADMRAAAGGVK
jgi:hypothetical protein